MSILYIKNMFGFEETGEKLYKSTEEVIQIKIQRPKSQPSKKRGDSVKNLKIEFFIFNYAYLKHLSQKNSWKNIYILSIQHAGTHRPRLNDRRVEIDIESPFIVVQPIEPMAPSGVL